MEPTRPVQSDEIDLSHFLRSIVRGFRNFGQSILNGIAALRRLFVTNFSFFVVVIGLGLALASSYTTMVKRSYYTSSMIISCRYLNMRIVENAIEKLNLLCEEKDRHGLSEILGINLKIASNIRGFETKTFVSETDKVEIEVLKEKLNNVSAEKKDLVSKIIEKIEIENSQAFQIDVSVFNADVVKAIDSALIRYFKNSEFVSKRMDRYRASLIERRTKLVSESKKLDSLKSVLYANFQMMSKQSREGSNNVILSDKYLTDPLNVFKEDLNLNNEIRSIDDQLMIRSDFEVIDGLTTFREPANLSLPVILVQSLLISVAAGYILIGLRRFNKYLATIG